MLEVNSRFEIELRDLINRYSVDNELGMHDFVLSVMIVEQLAALAKATNRVLVLSQQERHVPEVTQFPPKPDQAPRPGYTWKLVHEACDQGHYGSSSWQEVRDRG
jgi:hypothetical protein